MTLLMPRRLPARDAAEVGIGALVPTIGGHNDMRAPAECDGRGCSDETPGDGEIDQSEVCTPAALNCLCSVGAWG